ncbi:hypothetical protein JY98_03800 [Exiguobacterium mexicanum]|nr:hypothetical protein JY98_03800 [Exiguobacterium mexicanum]
MNYITLNGKEYELHFKNREMDDLEERTGKGLVDFFKEFETGKMRPFYDMLFVMLKRHDDFKHMPREEFLDYLDDALENGLSFQDLAEVIKTAAENSPLLKQALEVENKTKLEATVKKAKRAR